MIDRDGKINEWHAHDARAWRAEVVQDTSWPQIGNQSLTARNRRACAKARGWRHQLTTKGVCTYPTGASPLVSLPLIYGYGRVHGNPSVGTEYPSIRAAPMHARWRWPCLSSQMAPRSSVEYQH